jgi:hypothetical protein
MPRCPICDNDIYCKTCDGVDLEAENAKLLAALRQACSACSSRLRGSGCDTGCAACAVLREMTGTNHAA